MAKVDYLQTPHFPPSLAQCLQYLQFLQAWQGSEPVTCNQAHPASGPQALVERSGKSVSALGI